MPALAQRRPQPALSAAARPSPTRPPITPSQDAAPSRPNWRIGGAMAGLGAAGSALAGSGRLANTPQGALMGLGFDATTRVLLAAHEGRPVGMKDLKDDLLTDAGKGVAKGGLSSALAKANPLGVAKYMGPASKEASGSLLKAGAHSGIGGAISGAVGGVFDGGMSLVDNFSAWRSGELDTAAYAADAMVDGGMGVATGAIGGAIGGALGAAAGAMFGGAAAVPGAMLGQMIGAAAGAGLGYAADATGFTRYAKDSLAGGFRQADAFALKQKDTLNGPMGHLLKATAPMAGPMAGALPMLLQGRGLVEQLSGAAAEAPASAPARAPRAAAPAPAF